MGSCLDDHEPACGWIDLQHCPFESQLGPTFVSGTTVLGPREFSVGAFGVVYGEGSSISVAIATDEVALGNYLWAVEEFAGPSETSADIVQVFGGATIPGTYPVWVSIPGPRELAAEGTLTISELQIDRGSEESELSGQLDVDEGDWNLHGQLTIPGCSKLEAHLP